MSLQIVSYEATTFIGIDDEDNLADELAPYCLDPEKCASVFAKLESRAGIVPENLIGIVEAYATGEEDDLDDGDLKAFVRVSLLVDLEEESGLQEFDDPLRLLNAVYKKLELPDSIDGEFEFTDADLPSGFACQDPANQAALERMIARHDEKSAAPSI